MNGTSCLCEEEVRGNLYGASCVQGRLSGSVIFSKLGLQSGYQQVPVDPVDQKKTAVWPGPGGMGLFQFTRIPFGLRGAPSSFQR